MKNGSQPKQSSFRLSSGGLHRAGLLCPGGLVPRYQAQTNPLGAEKWLDFGHERARYTPIAARPFSPFLTPSMPAAVSFLGSSCVCTKLFCRGTSPLLIPCCWEATMAWRAWQSVVKPKTNIRHSVCSRCIKPSIWLACARHLTLPYMKMGGNHSLTSISDVFYSAHQNLCKGKEFQRPNISTTTSSSCLTGSFHTPFLPHYPARHCKASMVTGVHPASFKPKEESLAQAPLLPLHTTSYWGACSPTPAHPNSLVASAPFQPSCQ